MKQSYSTRRNKRYREYAAGVPVELKERIKSMIRVDIPDWRLRSTAHKIEHRKIKQKFARLLYVLKVAENTNNAPIVAQRLKYYILAKCPLYARRIK